MKVDPLAVELGYALVPLVDQAAGGNLLDSVSAVRRQIALDLGFVVPKIRIRDNLRLSPNSYAIKLRGEAIAEGELMVNRFDGHARRRSHPHSGQSAWRGYT